VGSNLFGDILTDLGAAIAGSIGIGASANINPEKRYPSCFEPVHGSAPDIVGRGIANPLGQIWSGALMLEHFGYPKAHDLVVKAMTAALESGIKTADLGGTATTKQVTAEVARQIHRLAS
jgi:tartrate dehydrogenase/decarboxylase/D-malate dehydrogenase